MTQVKRKRDLPAQTGLKAIKCVITVGHKKT